MSDKLPEGMALYRIRHSDYRTLEVIAPGIEAAWRHYLSFKLRIYNPPYWFLSVQNALCPPPPSFFLPPPEADWEVLPLPSDGVSWEVCEHQEIDERYDIDGERVC